MMDMHRGSRTAASPGVRVETRSSGKQARGRACDEQGQAAVEFAIVMPLLLTILLGVVLFGIAINDDVALTFATDTGAQLLSISRGQTTDPCQTASQAVYSAAPQLNQTNLKFTIVLDGTSVTTNATQPSCSGSQQYLVQSHAAQVTATYPCNLNIFGLNPVPNCTLTAQTRMLIQ
jgi:Flp pilus assembly protein TadG